MKNLQLRDKGTALRNVGGGSGGICSLPPPRSLDSVVNSFGSSS